MSFLTLLHWCSMRYAVLTTFIMVVGCGKKADDEEYTGGGEPSRSTVKAPDRKEPSSGPDTSPKKPTFKKSLLPKEDEPIPSAAVGMREWSRVGDVRVKIDKAKVEKPTLIGDGINGEFEYEGREVEFLLWVVVDNMSVTKKLEYHRWEAGFSDSELKLIDEHGNDYRSRNFPIGRIQIKGGLKYSTTTVYPGSPPITDILKFQKPVDAANELRLTLPSQISSEKGKHEFRIPSSAWKN